MSIEDKIRTEIYTFLTTQELYFSTPYKSRLLNRRLTVKETKEKIIKLTKKIVKGLK